MVKVDWGVEYSLASGATRLLNLRDSHNFDEHCSLFGLVVMGLSMGKPFLALAICKG